MVVTGTQLEANVKVNALATNQLIETPTGMYVGLAAGITVADTDTVDLTLDGVTGVLEADVKLSPAVTAIDNTIVSNVNGLYSPEVTITSDNTCVDGGVGATYMIREITNTGSNAFTINGAPEHTTISNSAGSALTPVGVTVNAAALFTSPNAVTLVVNNPSTCRAVHGLVYLKTELEVAQGAGDIFQLLIQLSFNGGAFATTVTLTKTETNNFNNARKVDGFAMGAPQDLAAGGTNTYIIRMGVNALAYGGTPRLFNTCISSAIVYFGSTVGTVA
jgi:hypothetical protein